MFSVQAVNGEHEGLVFPVNERLLLGRSSRCDITLVDKRVSRRHACFHNLGRQLHIEDLKSQNGTHVNSVRISDAILYAGDVVRVGRTKFRVCAPTASSSHTIELVESPEQAKPQIVKRVNPTVRPSLRRMKAVDYFTAIGVTEEFQPQPPSDQQLRRKTRDFAVLFEISQIIQHKTTLDDMLESISDVLIEVLRSDMCLVALLDNDQQLDPRVVRRRTPEGKLKTSTERLPLSRTVARLVLEDRCGVISADPRTDHRFKATDSSDGEAANRSVLAVPILEGSQVTGLIELGGRVDTARFDESDLDLLGVVSSMMGVAIKNVALAKQKAETIDALRRAQEQIKATQERLIRTEHMAEVGRVTYGITHELNNYLNPLNLAEMLQERYPADGELNEIVSTMIAGRERIFELVEDMRASAAGNREAPRIMPHGLADLAGETLRFLHGDADIRRCDVQVDPTSPNPIVRVVAKRIQQVILNLVRNAAQAMAPGGGRIVISVQLGTGFAAILVADDGPGIPENIGAKIFEPNFTTKGQGGMGIGLHLSRRIVEEHQGELQFRSTLGEGTTFILSLPIESPTCTDHAPTNV